MDCASIITTIVIGGPCAKPHSAATMKEPSTHPVGEGLAATATRVRGPRRERVVLLLLLDWGEGFCFVDSDNNICRVIKSLNLEICNIGWGAA